jgi:prefoldin subunit 5
MFKPSPKTALFATLVFLSAAALPTLAKQGNGHGNNNSGTSSTNNTSSSQGGGPPACRDLQGTIDQLQSMINGLTQSIATINANVNNINTNVSGLGSRIDTVNASIVTLNSRLDTITANINTFGARLDTITSTLDTLEQDISDIQVTLQSQGINALQASVVVDESACVSGAPQCASATAANSTNQNPVALNVLVMNGSTPVTNLTASNFTLTTDFGPGGGGSATPNLVFCTAGDTGCGTGTFVVNSGSGGYQLWLSPNTNWVPGTYTAQLKVTDTQGHSTIQLVNITIPA